MFRQKCWLHCLRHVRAGAVQEPLGTLLQGLSGMSGGGVHLSDCQSVPGDHIRGGLQLHVEDGGGEGRAGHAAAGNCLVNTATIKSTG